MYRPIDPTGLDFKIGLPYEEQYKAPRIVMMKSFDQQEYIQNFKGDLSILQLTATNPTDFIGVSLHYVQSCTVIIVTIAHVDNFSSILLNWIFDLLQVVIYSEGSWI